MRGARAGTVAVLAAFTLGLAAGASPAAGGAQPKALIAYSDGKRILTVRADGTNPKALTTHSRQHRSLEDVEPTWSPDGTRIAFDREGPGRIYVTRPDSAHAHQLVGARSNQYDYAPAWSPDGERIAFLRQIARTRALIWEIVVARVNGSQPVVLRRIRVTGRSNLHSVRFPGELTFSPNDSTLLVTEYKFRRHSGQDRFRRSLYSIPASGGDETLFAKHASSPSFSPNGKRMVYVSEADKNGVECYEECSIHGELYMAHADGSKPRRLTHTKRAEESPSWSADGRYVVYSAPRTARSRPQLESIPVHGDCAPVKLTSAKAGAFEPAWEPDASRSSDPGVCPAS